MSAHLRIYKIIISILLLFTFFSPVYAAETTESGKPVDASTYKAPQHTDYTMNNIMGSMLCVFNGERQTGGPCLVSTGDGKQEQLTLYDRVPGGGAIAQVTSLIAATYQPPISSVGYLADLGTNFGITKPAYAQVQGAGAQIIAPILQLWKVMRNIAYMGFVIIFIVIGFMIMFRQKLNPQTVISAQNALPGVVVALVLVYLSYFISALIVDSAFVGIPLVAEIFAQTETNNIYGNTSAELQNNANNSGLFYLVYQGLKPWEAAGRVSNDLSAFTSQMLFKSKPGIGTKIVVGLLTAPISILVFVIFTIIIFVQYIRLLIALIKAYITILVMTMFGPILILFSAIPGKGGTVSLWWKSILANTLIFPAVFMTFLLGGLILSSSENLWAATPPLIGGNFTFLIRDLIGYGIILGITAVPDMVKNALGVKDLQGIPQAAVGALTGGYSLAKAGVSKYIEPYKREIDMQRKANLERTTAAWGSPAPPPPPSPPPIDTPWYLRYFGKR